MNLIWSETGRTYGTEELIHWHGKGVTSLESAISRTRIIVLGPHSSATFPAELAPFIHRDVTLRRQLDYSDYMAGLLGRQWASSCEGLIYIENPHSRIVLDPNRPLSSRPMDDLRSCFERIREQGANATLAGVDMIRPVTFGGWPVLREPRSPIEWQAFEEAWIQAAYLGAFKYIDISRKIVETCIKNCEAMRQRLIVFSLHDTMNCKMGADGSINIARPESDQLPHWVNIGNLGNETGNPIGASPVSMESGAAIEMVKLFQCALRALGDVDENIVTLNKPYKGAHETKEYGLRLCNSQLPDGSGVLQLEFRRESLLGSEATLDLQHPGTGWPAPDMGLLQSITASLAKYLTNI